MHHRRRDGEQLCNYGVQNPSPDLPWLAALYGPVCTESYDPVWMGARRGTNNAAELTAIGEACKWLLELDGRLPQGAERKATILYDSEYAYEIATGLNRDKENGALSESVAALVSSVRRKFVLNFRHVYGHTGVHGNEVADRLADRGALGRVSPHAQSWI